jgi:hypothetical protein
MAIHVTAGRESGQRSLIKIGRAVMENGRTIIVRCFDRRIIDIRGKLNDAIAMGRSIPLTADMTFSADIRRGIWQHVGAMMTLKTTSRPIAKGIVNGQIIRRGRIPMATITPQLCVTGARDHHHRQR